VLGRCDDSSGLLGDVFRQAMGQLGRITEAAQPDPAPLAEQVFEVFCDNGYEVSTWERLYKPRMALLLKTAKGPPAARDATTCWKPRLISGANAMAAAPDGSRFSTQQRCCAGCQRRASASPLGSAT
jgi:hypothetical protein